MASRQDRRTLGALRNASKHGRHSIRHFLGLGSNSSKLSYVEDVVFVAIDFENRKAIKQIPGSGHNSQLGLAILDTKDLINSPPQSTISVLSYATGSSTYHASVSEKFRLGTTVRIERENILMHIEAAFPRTRNVVLVGHDIMNELLVLRHLGFDMDTSIVGIMDTQALASQVLRRPSLALESLLQELGCSYGELHTAGHDAYFTLRALLALASKSCAGELQDNKKLYERFQAIAAIIQSPIPFPECKPHMKESGETRLKGQISQHQRYKINRRSERQPKKEMRRSYGTRKHASKSWELDTQEHVRAERALNKSAQEKTTANKSRDWWDYVALVLMAIAV